MPSHSPCAVAVLPGPSPSHRRGFTLIELLVVIVIIGILVAVAVTVASKVAGGGRSRLAEDVLKILDQTRTAAAADLEGRLPSKFVDGQGNEFPIVDATDSALGNPLSDGRVPASIGLYYLSVSKLKGLEDMFKSIDAKLVRRVPTLVTPFGTPKDAQGVDLPTLIVTDPFRSPVDGTVGQPIRFVHEMYDGGYGPFASPVTGALASGREMLRVYYKQGGVDRTMDMRRSYRPFDTGAYVGDADEGVCPGKTPYFYSIGPDGDPGGRADNVYFTKPSYPTETAKGGQ